MKLLSHFTVLTVFLCSGLLLRAAGGTDVAVYNAILASVKPGQNTVEVGDMVVTVDMVRAWRDRAMGLRGASRPDVTPWTGGVVHCAFESGLTEEKRRHFRDACAEWALFAQLTFTPRTGEPNYIMVREDPAVTGGSSALGMTGGRQFLTMGTGSWNRVTLVHELGHALGLIHEHERSDREAYVEVLSANVTAEGQSSYVRIPSSTHGTVYDFDSVMHYWDEAFAVTPGQKTMRCRPGYEQHQDTMGRAPLDRWLSRGDRAMIAGLYGPGPALSTVVTNTNDSGPGSLRAALYHTLDLAAEAPESSPVISFQIPLSDPGYSGGVFTIRPTGRLPGPGGRVTVDGTTQTLFSGDTNPAGPEIVLSGERMTSAVEPGRAFILGESGTVVRGLVIQSFTADGISITGDNNRVEGCYIGISASGTAAAGNATEGIQIVSGASGNTVGGPTPGERNVISGNGRRGVVISGGAGGNVVSGNFIGTSASGTAALPNAWSGVAMFGGATGNTVGPANVISGNLNRGVSIVETGTTGNVVRDNFIGTTADGTAALANGWSGAAASGGASGNTVGPGNVISGNANAGLLITDADTSGNAVIGNTIGLNAARTAALPNAWAGVQVDLSAQGNVIGGASAAERNIVSGNLRQGIVISGAGTSGNVVKGNYVGTGAAGSTAFANAWAGVAVNTGAANNTVGPGNVISGNANQGVVLNGTGTDNNTVTGNFIGLTAAGDAALPNAWSGVNILGGASGNIVGAGNVISGNANHGVQVTGTGTSGNVVRGNFIGLNAAGTGAVPNAWSGVQITAGARAGIIGGFTAADRNVISGNTLQGVIVSGAGTTGNFVRGNYIGTNAAGTAAVANITGGVDVFGGATGNVIGGLESGAGNVISGNSVRGMTFSGAGTSANSCTGNLVGLNAAGTAALANAGPGIAVFGAAQDTGIGAIGGGRNFIAGNANSGLRISGAGTSGTRILGNSIGVTPGGTVVANSGDGVELFTGAVATVVGGSSPGSGNLIRGNARDGVGVFDAATVVAVEGNSIYENGGTGIDLAGNGVTANDSGDGDAGPNGLQNYPVLTGAVLGSGGTTVTGTLGTTAATAVRVDFYASVSGDEGQFYLGSRTGTTGSGGTLTISTLLAARVPAGYTITATATGPSGNTSEFSAPRTVTAADTDGDGLPNDWESAYGLNPGTSDAALDSDGDGESNLAEFRAGTHPRDGSSLLQLQPPALTPAAAAVSFAAAPGLTFRVDYSPSLAPGSWRLLADQLHAGSSPVTIIDPAAAPRRFYRLTVVP